MSSDWWVPQSARWCRGLVVSRLLADIDCGHGMWVLMTMIVLPWDVARDLATSNQHVKHMQRSNSGHWALADAKGSLVALLKLSNAIQNSAMQQGGATHLGGVDA